MENTQITLHVSGEPPVMVGLTRASDSPTVDVTAMLDNGPRANPPTWRYEFDWGACDSLAQHIRVAGYSMLALAERMERVAVPDPLPVADDGSVV